MSPGDIKLLELINALLTTTGCGQGAGRPQPIELWFSAVNRFMRIILLNFPNFWFAPLRALWPRPGPPFGHPGTPARSIGRHVREYPITTMRTRPESGGRVQPPTPCPALVELVQDPGQIPAFLVVAWANISSWAGPASTPESADTHQPKGPALAPRRSQERRDKRVERGLDVGRGLEALAVGFLRKIRIPGP